MELIYTWQVTGLKIRNELRPETVVQTFWEKIGTDVNGVTGTFTGATPFTVDPTDDSGPFIPFEELTEEDVIEWIKAIVVGDYEQHVNSQIEKQILNKITPSTEAPLPWADTSTEE